jgi:hypothetical protein
VSKKNPTVFYHLAKNELIHTMETYLGVILLIVLYVLVVKQRMLITFFSCNKYSTARNDLFNVIFEMDNLHRLQPM